MDEEAKNNKAEIERLNVLLAQKQRVSEPGACEKGLDEENASLKKQVVERERELRVKESELNKCEAVREREKKGAELEKRRLVELEEENGNIMRQLVVKERELRAKQSDMDTIKITHEEEKKGMKVEQKEEEIKQLNGTLAVIATEAAVFNDEMVGRGVTLTDFRGLARNTSC